MPKKHTLLLFILLLTGIVNAFSQANAGPDQFICSDSTIMQADNPYPNSGYWEVVSGSGLFETPTLFNSKVTLVGHGENTFRWVVSIGSILYYDTMTITNNSPGEAKIIGPIDTTTCDGTITLTAEMPVPYYECDHYWTLIAGNGNFNSQSNDFTVNVTELVPDATIFAWNLQKGVCWNHDIIIIQNNQVEAHAGDDQTICSDSTVLEALAPNFVFPFQGTGHWTNLSGNMAIIENSNDHVSRVSNLQQGTTILEWTVELENCSADDLVIITNNDFELIAGPDITVCDDYMEIPIENNTSWSYLSGCGTIVENTTSSKWEVDLCTGANILVETKIINSCTNTDTLIIYNELPSNSEIVIPLNDTVIYHDFIQLTAVEPIQGNGLWTVDSPGITFDNATSFSTTARNIPLGSHLFTWAVSNPPCASSTDIVTVTRNELKAYAGEDFYLPNYASSALLNAILPPGTNGFWTVLQGTGILIDPTDPNALVSNLSEGENRLKWTVSYAKTSDDDEILITKRTETVYAGPDQMICSDSTQMQAANPAPYTGHWSEVNTYPNIINDTLFNTRIKNIYPGINKFVWSVNIDGELYTDTVNIVNNETRIFMSNDIVVCDDYIFLNAMSYPNTPGLWSVTSGNGVFDDPTSSQTMVRELTLGNNTFRWTVSNEFCTNYDEVNVLSTLPDKFQLNAGPDQTVYTNSTFMNADPVPDGWEGYWTIWGGSANIIDPTLNTTEITNLNPGANIFNWQINNPTYGCAHSDLVVINYTHPLAYAGPDQELCVDSTYMQANDQSLYDGYWHLLWGSGTIANPSLYNSLVTDLGSGKNTFRWYVTIENIPYYDEVILQNNSLLAVAGTDFETCLTNAILSAVPEQPDETGLWTKIAGTGIIATPSLFNSLVSNLSPGVNVFQWTVNNGMCSNSDQVQVINNQITSINTGLDFTLCNDYTEFPIEENNTWSYLSGCGSIVENTTTNMWEVNLCPGDNILGLTVTNEICSASDTLVITNDSPSEAMVGPDQEICENFTLISASLPVIGTGTWSVAAGSGVFDCETCTTTTVTDIGPDLNIFRWAVTNGYCSSSADIGITNNAVFAFAGDDLFVCADSAYLNYSYNSQWTLLSGCGTIVVNTIENTAGVYDLCEGENEFLYTITLNNCSSSDTMSIFNDLMVRSAGNDTTVNTETFQLNAENPSPGTGIWTVLSGSGIFENPVTFNSQVSGYEEGENTFRWSVTNNGCLNSDDVIITYDPVNINDLSFLNMQVYPNPTDGLINLTSTFDLMHAAIELTTITGQTVYFQRIEKSTNTYNIDISNLEKGLYVIKINANGKTGLMKLIKK